jgi:type IV secretion system protein VirB4
VLLALMALQFRRYPAARSSPSTSAVRSAPPRSPWAGDWHDLGGGLTEGADASVSLQPLARIHDTYERAWAADWIAAILMREGIAITPEVKEHSGRR